MPSCKPLRISTALTLIMAVGCLIFSGCEFPVTESVQAAAAPAKAAASSAPAVTAAPTAGSRDAAAMVLDPAVGSSTGGNEYADIDVSTANSGYVSVRYIGENDKIKMQLTRNGDVTYTYNLYCDGQFDTFTLSCGSGDYVLNIYKNIEGDQYAMVCSESFAADIADEFAPFLYPNQYISFDETSECVALGESLAVPADTDLDVVGYVYDYVTQNIAYDYEKAKDLPYDYLPDVDATLAAGTGICFDYAALMSAMLRSQRIPTRLVVGYAGDAYHAWISVYVDDIGWVDGIIQFNGTDWVRMDPTFAAGSNSLNPDVQAYIGDGKNYNAMFVY